MSFFGKFMPGSNPSGQPAASPNKKDSNAPQFTTLEKHLATLTGPPRADGSDKFFGFENYGSTCYCNSIIQCLYYSEPFREHVINFPSKAFLDDLHTRQPNGAPPTPRSGSITPWPNPTSPARKQNVPGSPGPGAAKPEENKESPEYRKRLALQTGPVLDMTYDNSNHYGMDESLFTSLRDIFEAIVGNKSRMGVVSPHRFLEILRRENEMFRSAMHQDAHEFLNLLLNQVVDNVELFSKQHPNLGQANGGAPEQNFEQQLTKAFGRGTTATESTRLDTHWIHDLFEGILTSETRCLTCETISQRDEPFLDLSVDLDPHTSITSCLRRFSMEEMLRERNKFHCDTCGGLQEAEKRMKIKRLPHILALHLKRFKYTEDLQRLQKLFHRVVYPFFLRLFNTSHDAEDAERIYELYAVVVHIGGGPYHGHYVSIIKTKDRGWLLFDDELVEPVSKSYVENFFGGEPMPGLDPRQLACAYVLFYQKTTEQDMWDELAAEGQPDPTRVSDAETAKDGIAPSTKQGNELTHTATVAIPTTEEMEHMDALAHAKTAPISSGSPVDPASTASLVPGKTKKELKQEEKERKAKDKEDRKVAEKALEERRKAASAKRLEELRQQNNDEMAALEMNKNAEKRGDEAVKEGGLARFRHGSMSLRGRPKFFGKEKDKEKEKTADGGTRIFSVPQTNGAASQAVAGATDGEEATTALPTLPSIAAAKAEKKNRFSLGRRKPTVS